MNIQSIQPVHAPRDCGGCAEFRKLTGDFIQNVINAIRDPNLGPQPHLSEFRKLTAQWERDVINVVLIGDPNQIPGLHQVYEQNVLRIFLGGPDTIPGLLDAYSQEVKRIFGLQSPPSGQ